LTVAIPTLAFDPSGRTHARTYGGGVFDRRITD
jgi:hypothetical protein